MVASYMRMNKEKTMAEIMTARTTLETGMRFAAESGSGY